MSHIDTLDGAIVSFLNYVQALPLTFQEFHGGANQQWRLERVDGSSVWPTWKLHNVQSKTVVDLAFGGAKNGNPIIGQVNEDNNNNQLWHLVSADPLGPVVMIQNIGTGTYIDLFNGSSANLASQFPPRRTKITGWAGTVQDKNPHQLWRVLRMN
ncbi:hypothetical protein NPX13_g3570 [Xylaria arbuscula]|uniref:Ricin B lectin domain-containing protein n=1 Tax=Xylaria arbuscula TaxID=114810 RepID=A0A9W8TMP9_9PEZI|nr:hypothetical protein NPX13_g3570 [Xylaria arbuscula]